LIINRLVPERRKMMILIWKLLLVEDERIFLPRQRRMQLHNRMKVKL
jgi:hypothetical protein